MLQDWNVGGEVRMLHNHKDVSKMFGIDVSGTLTEGQVNVQRKKKKVLKRKIQND